MNNTINILQIEDNLGDAKLIEELLLEENFTFSIKHVERLQEGLNELSTRSYDIVLLDLALPDCIGFSTFAKIKALVPSMPIIVLTGTTLKRATLKQCLDSADDYLVKGHVDSKSLVDAIIKAVDRYSAKRKLHSHFVSSIKRVSFGSQFV